MGLQSKVGRSRPWSSASDDAACTLFGPDSDCNLSHTITVDDEPIVVKAFNLIDGDEVLVEMVDGEGAGRAFAPFCPINGQATLTTARNVLPIGISGRYRFVLQRSDGTAPSVGQVLVRYHTATLTQEWLSAYMQCAK